ncbi:MAG: tetraacyldisaccharide 4'-kinase [Gallionellales bacterium 35-53-114]|nr:MAG: tetraacyldisaccharide 4'-kinase [Gallionellales bacterium 35-53-114]OYZ64977.1 MAG: tetraacyldisaccharide 4'-kinase [Gallionellales bacterium 24-53-125]OZB07841.1 MAG: tetraacyldisaccharide 4'-kinase [Gallionellales bacterium 39-52-133]HQS58617.1 tetraacyldisaccharide 4'-kinase [Gallionellaceae bacterium]HQS74958.1 tetraacyldisaccharide 4'-kinase [Gallionellaceae bacterium]
MHGLQWHWYRITPLHLLLWPLSLIFHLIVTIRRLLFRLGISSSIKLPVPVIIVGNISVGGTGKTPLTLWLAEQLLADGWHPGIISRGFGGKGNKPQEVLHDSDPAQVGDEPALMAQRLLCPVWTGRDRPAAARALLAAHPECDVIISDDGLQHYRLQRDVEIAVVDGIRRFGNGFLLPAGPLREPPSRLREVDAVVVNGDKVAVGEFMMQLEGVHFYNLLNPEMTATAADFQGQTVHAVAGIGHPERFFGYLKKLGLILIAHPYPDHHQFSAADLVFSDGNALLMTEKDAVKCMAIADEKCWVLRVDARLDPALIQFILKKITP